MIEKKPWHSLYIEELENLLRTNRDIGLTEKEAFLRLSKYGFNELPERKKPSLILRFLSQFNDFMIWVLIVAVFISAILLKEILDASVIAAIVIINAILGFVQEYKAEQAITSLKKLTAPKARAIRDGKLREILARELVPGDLILIETGDRIPADARLIEAHNFRVNEAILTGESLPVTKTTKVEPKKSIPLLDQKNMIFLGTSVMSGRGKAVVTATGANTEMGKIAQLVQEPEQKETPLQKELQGVGKRIALICLIIAAIVFGLGILRGNSWSLMFLAAVSLAVAAIPEGLPAIVTITLALGLERMAKKNAILRRLPAVETLGAATYICTDKTGTLTRNEMRVGIIKLAEMLIKVEDTKFYKQSPRPEVQRAQIQPLKEERLKLLLTVGALCNNARKGANGAYLGDPTEIALQIAAEEAGLKTLSKKFPRLNEIPFDSERKMMTTIHRKEAENSTIRARYLVCSKGAPEIILDKCTHILTEHGSKKLTKSKKEEILKENSQFAAQAYRTLAFALKEIDHEPQTLDSRVVETDLTFIGLTGLSDPPRPEVYEAIKVCKNAKIKIAMVTGDHRATAEAIGQELSLTEKGAEVITSLELDKMTDQELTEKAERIAIYARISAKDKIRIIEALRERGHTIAMTGDGVNDAPALKKADIGVAMGKIGSDVTKEASDMILTDDNFATIVAAIREGRVIFDNLKKFIYFLLSCNISEVLVMLLAMLFGMPLPLLPVQILWINLVTDGFPALALGVDVPEPGVMKRAPRKKEESILSIDKQLTLLWQGFLMTIGALASFIVAYYLLKMSLTSARTILFTTLVLVQLLHSFNARSETKSPFEIGFLSNRSLLLALGFSLFLQLAIIYTPYIQPLFHTTFINLESWVIILICSLFPAILIEFIKKLNRS